VKRLQAEKAELIRELEFEKAKSNNANQVAESADSSKNDEVMKLTASLLEAQEELASVRAQKETLNRRMAMIDAESQRLQKQLAETKIAELSDDSEAAVQNEFELKTMRAEIASLEAQNKMLLEAQAIDRERIRREVMQEQKRIATSQERPNSVRSEPIAMAEPTKQSKQPEVAPQPASIPRANIVLSGDEIRELVAQSKIPLQSSIDRVERVSNADFAAFRWDTGMVYGSGEQSRVNNAVGFNGFVQNYIQKTASRCQGNFDQDVRVVNTVNDIMVKSADIACVNDNAEGNAASILFFTRGDMVYALAHEADMQNFTVAMDMRDRLAGTVDQIF
jgi:hypothetical protein